MKMLMNFKHLKFACIHAEWDIVFIMLIHLITIRTEVQKRELFVALIYKETAPGVHGKFSFNITTNLCV